jgi:hypothetical protein
MSGTMLKHPLVRGYLHDLSGACLTLLPPAQARELRDQIAAHLDEALPPDADDDAVRTELARLGNPHRLAADAVGPVPPSAGVKMRNVLSRVRWWAWTSIAIVIVAVGAVAAYNTVVNSVPPLEYQGISGWYFPQDYTRSVDTTAGDVTQSAVPARDHQQQGFVIGIENNTDWTQTILGVDRSTYPDDPEQVLLHVTVAVATGPGVGHGFWTPRSPQTRWVLPAVIPPHSYRVLRVLWITDQCMPSQSSLGIQDVTLRVRVGMITKTEQILLHTFWTLTGTKGSKC